MNTTKTSSPAYLLKGFKLLSHPRVRLFVIAPLLINFLLFAIITTWAFGEFNDALTVMLGNIPEWLQFLAWIIWPIFVVLLLMVYGYTFAIVSNLIGSPFYGLLAERIAEVISNESNNTPMTLKKCAKIGQRAFIRELQKLWYFLPRLAAVVITSAVLTFIPIVSVIAPAITFLWGAWSLSLQYLDYPADNSEVDFKQLLSSLRRSRSTSIGFGGIVLGVSAIPIVNLFAAPAAVAGATMLWVEKFEPSKNHSIQEQSTQKKTP